MDRLGVIARRTKESGDLTTPWRGIRGIRRTPDRGLIHHGRDGIFPDLFRQRELFHKGQHRHEGGVNRFRVLDLSEVKRGKGVIGVLIIMNRQGKLTNIIGALHPARRLPRGLNRGKEDSYQDSNDRDNDQKLHQRESFTPCEIFPMTWGRTVPDRRRDHPF